ERHPILLAAVDPHGDRGLAVAFGGSGREVRPDARTEGRAVARLHVLPLDVPVRHDMPPSAGPSRKPCTNPRSHERYARPSSPCNDRGLDIDEGRGATWR